MTVTKLIRLFTGPFNRFTRERRTDENTFDRMLKIPSQHYETRAQLVKYVFITLEYLLLIDLCLQDDPGR